MRICTVAFAGLTLCLFTATAPAQETCHTMTGQFADLRLCVSSMRAPEGSTNFSPENLLATGDGAWCASAEANQTVTLHMKPAPPMRTITMTNGYAKSEETFRQNGRVKRAMIETNTGY